MQGFIKEVDIMVGRFVGLYMVERIANGIGVKVEVLVR